MYTMMQQTNLIVIKRGKKPLKHFCTFSGCENLCKTIFWWREEEEQQHQSKKVRGKSNRG